MSDLIQQLSSQPHKVFWKVQRYRQRDKWLTAKYEPYRSDDFDYGIKHIDFLVTDINEITWLLEERFMENDHTFTARIIIVDYNLTEISKHVEWAIRDFFDEYISLKVELNAPKLKFIPDWLISEIDTFTNCYSLTESDIVEEYEDDYENWLLSVHGPDISLTRTINLKNDPDTAPDAQWLAENLGVNSQEELEVFWAKNLNHFLKKLNLELKNDAFKNKHIKLILNFTNPIKQPWRTGLVVKQYRTKKLK